MDFRIIFPVFSMLSFGIFHLGAPAALGLGTEPAPARHSRTKRCSCASFLDKECVYFCHLDIIWVNTPERTVSYGLGNAPRKKRSVTEPVMPFSRCKCAESRDKTCSLFCRTDTTTTKSEATSHGPIHHCAEKKCKQKMQMTRPKNTKRTDVLSRLRAVKNINLLLKKWRERRH